MAFLIGNIIKLFGGYDGIIHSIEQATREVIADMPSPEPEPTTPNVPYPKRTILPERASWPLSRAPSVNGPVSQTPLRLTLPGTTMVGNLPPSPVLNKLFDSKMFIENVISKFLKNIQKIYIRDAVSWLLTFKSFVDPELDAIKVQIDLLQDNQIFRDLYNSSTADRQERLIIMLMDGIVKAKTLQNGKYGRELIKKWREKHPEPSFGGSRRKTRKAKRKRSKYSKSRYIK